MEELKKRLPKNAFKRPEKREKSSTQQKKTPVRHVHDMDPDHHQQCGTCCGSGKVTCSSCNGMGGRSESRVDYDWENNPTYRDEWVSCYSCNGGYSTCSGCGGSGSVPK